MPTHDLVRLPSEAPRFHGDGVFEFVGERHAQHAARPHSRRGRAAGRDKASTLWRF